MDNDEEGEILEQHVTDYLLENDKVEVVSFSTLPVKWDDNEEVQHSGGKVYLRGLCDDGLQNIYKEVIAWKFEVSYALPEISVLTRQKKWFILQKPKKKYEGMIRETLIAVHWIHFVKKNPGASEKCVWKYLWKNFSSFENLPSKNDLLAQMELIRVAARRDKDLETSMSFLTLAGKHKSDFSYNEDVGTPKKHKFIDDADDVDGSSCGEELAEQEEIKMVCEICDDGGDLLSCEGRCLRSFHPTIADGVLSNCESLGYNNKKEVDAILNFLCKNCQYQQHQCYACGRLGSSAKSSSQEVFQCISASCGHFFHPRCVSKLLHADDENQAEQVQVGIAAGESFACPSHKCFLCKKVEDENIPDLQFAMCRRCPKAYHMKCLPGGILFERDCTEHDLARAWDGLLPNQRILIYCLDHEIDRQLRTPLRNHLIFPDSERRNEKQTSGLEPRKINIPSHRNMVPEDSDIDRTAVKRPKVSVETTNLTKNIERRCPGQNFDTGRALKDGCPVTHRGYAASGSYPCKSEQQYVASSKIKNNVLDRTMMKEVDSEMENRIEALMKDVDSSFDTEEFMKRQNAPSIYAYSARNELDKSITLGKMECAVQAVRAATKKLKNGCSIEDAKAVCKPEDLKQIYRWKKKLEIYLAPFLHGNRYTSYGRHFTQVEKLNEIVNRLHYYVRDGDTVVDFCCGSNDFSCLMKEKLENTGKSCSFKNYDIIQPKNNFSFEKRDWMTVDVKELPDGSKLIMGLNPPFGVKSALANRFISKALEFRPKLIILIAPSETRRLDRKAQYDLIWTDDRLLSGKSFYLPGAFYEKDDEQVEDWNVHTPPLSLWSRADWTSTHVAIAQERGHISKDQEGFNLTEGKPNRYLYFTGDLHARAGFPNPISVTQDNSRLEPEGTGATVTCEQRNVHCSGYVNSEGCQNKHKENYSHENLNESHDGGCQTQTTSLQNPDEAIPFEAVDWSVDMDLSSTFSPIIHSDILSIQENNPFVTHDTSVMVAGESSFPYPPSDGAQNWMWES